MKEALKVTEKIQYLSDTREEAFKREEIPLRDAIYEEIFDSCPNESKNVQFALGFAKFLEKKSIRIIEQDVLAGYPYHYGYNTTFPIAMEEDFDPAYRPDIELDGEREARDIMAALGLSADSKEMQDWNYFAKGTLTWLFKHWHSGHILPGYDYVLELGLPALVKKGEEALEKYEGHRKDVVQSMLICDQAAIKYIKRYAARASELLQTTEDAEEKKYLDRIYKSCQTISEGKPETFFDAVQLLWFLHELMICESIPSSISLGRMDQYLYPFYKKDIESGTLTVEDAAEILDALWIKFSANLQAYQNITLGGTDANGNPAYNEVTYLCMHSTRKLRYDQPSLSFRYTDDLPEETWEELVALIQTGTGFPGIFYDKTCIDARIRSGVPKEDAVRYGIVGCVEMGTPGEEFTMVEISRLNWPKLIGLMLNNGKDVWNHTEYPLMTGKRCEDIHTFAEFYDWYKEELKAFTELVARCVNLFDRMLPKCYPLPYLSSIMRGCYESGKDLTEGGTKYNNSAVNACGIATTADSLIAIKKAVFEKKLVTLSEFRDALTADFKGYEKLHHFVSDVCPKFGNDDPEVDDIAKELLNLFSDTVEQFKTPRGGNFVMGIYSVEDHAHMGMRTEATPDGRLGGTAFSNSVASVQGKDTHGPTALVNSVVSMELNRSTNGMVLDIKLSPQFMKSKQHIMALRALIETYFEEGGLEIQFSVVSRETLEAAQADPKKYKNLVVRVSGFSAYFHSLQKATQDEIIARTEYEKIS